jgi:pyruvate/2-oxoglutarate dehydrogenase complex dihydrolipoamide dehydrogenase (E3) component
VEEFDVAVVGGGTAGITAAEVAQANGKRVVLIEQARIGGECTWDGCVPSKALIRAARLRRDIERAGEFGLLVAGVEVDFPAVMASVHQAIATIAQFEDAAHMEARGIAVRKEHARLIARNTLSVNGDQIHAARIILCTGSRPSIPPIDGLNDVPYLTNETLFDLKRLPQRLLVLGAGATGLEMGQAFRRLGSQVTVIDVEQRLLPREDADIAACAQRLLVREGLQFLLGAQVKRVSAGGESIAMEAVMDGSRRTVEGDTLLVATGRRPNTENLGLEAPGVKVGKQGIVVNERLETTAEGIHAAGDVTGLYPFTHVAAYQGRIAANNATGKGGKTNYRVVPWVIFTEPEIAHVGLTEAEARQRHGDGIRVVTLPYTAIDRAVIERQPQGLIKVIVGKKPLIGYALGKGEVIGAHLIGPLAGELLHEFVVSMQARTFSGRLAQAIHAYPTMSTGVQQAVGLLFPSGRATIDLREDPVPPEGSGIAPSGK